MKFYSPDKPYLFVSYRQLRDITGYKVNGGIRKQLSGIQFRQGEYETEDEDLIRALIEFSHHSWYIYLNNLDGEEPKQEKLGKQEKPEDKKEGIKEQLSKIKSILRI